MEWWRSLGRSTTPSVERTLNSGDRGRQAVPLDQREGTAAPCRVVVVGEIRFYRESLAAFLAGTDGIAVKGAAASDSEAAPFFVDGEPVIVLLDVAYPSDIEAVRRVRSLAPNAQVIALGLPEL